MRSLIAVIFTTIAFVICIEALEAGQGVKAASQSEVNKVARILESIVKVDDLSETINISNSQVVIDTTEIKQIVRTGPPVLPLLVLILKQEDISFDTFVRCYSACDQILSKDNPQVVVYWSGGATARKTPSGISRIFPNGQLDNKEFRKCVIDDIQSKMQKLK